MAPRLIIILGDQLDRASPALLKGDKSRDTVLMMEVAHESRHVPSHRARTVLFLSAMRHHAAWLRDQGWHVRYVTLDDPANTGTFAGEITRAARELQAREAITVEPGEHRVRADLAKACTAARLSFTTLEDPHFLTPRAEFEAWAKGRKETVMEYFYRRQRTRLGILMEPDGTTPLDGRWNYDQENRKSFPRTGPSPKPRPLLRFEPDALTRDVIACVERTLPELPGSLAQFAWPVTREQAVELLKDFVRHRLPLFGPFEDAMWTGEPFLYHSALSAALNLKLLHPRECVEAALAAFERGKVPIESVEAFIRQIIGWREFIRGTYDREGPDYETRNYLGHDLPLPDFYWTGKTDMACLRECVTQVLDHAFSHHIQRLMVLANFSLLAGVHPKAISDWFLGMYVDGVDWVTLPNTLGMAMHADGTTTKGPVVGTKPYAAGGAYIKRMSNYCTKCKYDPTQRTGEDACPFTTLYWDFMHRHRARFAKNPRMAQLLANLDRFGEEQVQQITISANAVRERIGIAK